MGSETRAGLAPVHVLFVSAEKDDYSEDKGSQALQSDHSSNNIMAKKEKDKVSGSNSGQFLLEEPKFCQLLPVPGNSPFIPGPSCCHGNQHGQPLLVLCLLFFTGLSTVLTRNRKSINTVERPL